MENTSNDITLDLKDKKFKFRVAGIIEQNGKILIVKMNNNKFFCLPGGHVELMEPTADAVKRELDEELYFNVNIEKLLYIHENFFDTDDGNNHFHELCFYYKAKPTKKDLILEDKTIEEQDKFGMVHHEFKWVDKDQLRKFKIEPKLIIEKFLKNGENFEHLVTINIK